MTDFLRAATEIQPELIRWRRDFHQFPELRFEETRTAEVVAHHLKSLEISTQTGVGKTGVVGLIWGGKPGPTALIRFDMDALPIYEETGVEYQSRIPGVMHACGHDAHTAIGMGVAKILAAHRHELAGNVKLAFQPAEEGTGGALAMIRDGVLENPTVGLSFGLHIQSQTPVGTLLIGDGPILAAADEFKITVNGKGGHGALPHETVDALVIAAQIVNLLQTIVSRNINQMETAILSIGSFQAGSAFNIIAETAELLGTIRTYDVGLQKLIHRRMREIAENTAKALGGSAEVEIHTLVPAAVNDPRISAVVRRLAVEMIGAERISTDQRDTPSDDIAEFLQAAPGCHFILGVGGPEYAPHHNPRFNFDESALPLGVALLCASVAHFLKDPESG